MYELKKNGKVFTRKFVGTGSSSYEERIYRAAVSQRLRNTAVEVQISPAYSENYVELKCAYNAGHMTGGRLNTGDTISSPD
jgi:hypothetical protein